MSLDLESESTKGTDTSGMGFGWQFPPANVTLERSGRQDSGVGQSQVRTHLFAISQTYRQDRNRTMQNTDTEIVQTQRGLRLLALDDGGTRGLSELLIIQELMKRLKFITHANTVPKPCEYFDLIGGVGTGGLIALILGRLGMHIDQAIEEYVRFTSRVYSDRKARNKKEMFKASVFEDGMKAIIKSCGLLPNALLQDDKSCRSFVVALPAVHMTPRIFRSYTVGANQGYNCTIVEAARVTTAIPGLFKPALVKDGGIQESFIGGNLGFSNPTKLLVEEVESVFGQSAHVACLVSIGSGQLGPISLQSTDASKMLNLVSRIATNSENVAAELTSQFKHISGVFHRLNVDQGLQNATFNDPKQLSEIKSHTLAYLHHTSVDGNLDDLVQALHTSPCKISVGIFRGLQLSQDVQTAVIEDIYQIPAPTQVFTGRRDILTKLDYYFAADHGSVKEKVQKRYVLYGLGGAGKTQIVLQFLAMHKSRFEAVYLIDASSRVSIEQFYKFIASQAKVSELNPAAGLKMTQELLYSLFFPPANMGTLSSLQEIKIAQFMHLTKMTGLRS
ncbi:hypothetical protein H2248_000101 [Termitomyces sp. 'cryptogamus']|nr:hypothetical protein H2248_000101 [Termitomyces sp. 'cryptogamus']